MDFLNIPRVQYMFDFIIFPIRSSASVYQMLCRLFVFFNRAFDLTRYIVVYFIMSMSVKIYDSLLAVLIFEGRMVTYGYLIIYTSF